MLTNPVRDDRHSANVSSIDASCAPADALLAQHILFNRRTWQGTLPSELLQRWCQSNQVRLLRSELAGC